MKKLVKWTLNSYYSFHEGMFTIDESYLEFIKDKKITAWFGEIEGKHSEVDYEFDKEDFKIVKCSEEFINEFETIIGEIGLNPFYAFGEIQNAFEDIDDYVDLTIKDQIDKLNEETNI